MEILILIAAIGTGLFFFIRSNTRRGAETVRAYVYLRGIDLGSSPDEANRIASIDAADGPTHVIQNAMVAVRQDFGGKQLAMIAEARRLGMDPDRYPIRSVA